MKLKLIQYYTPNCTYALTSEKINKEYCEKYDIEYFAETNEQTIREGSDNRAVQWYKIKFIQQQLRETSADYVIFIDADAVFVKPEKDVRDIIEQHLERDLIISEDFGPDTVNTGVMIFKNVPWSIDFLERIWEGGNKISRGNYRTSIWHEQTIMSAFIHINQADSARTVVLSPVDDDSINDNILRKGRTFIYHDLSKKRIEEIDKINSGTFNVITELNLACESDRQVSHRYGTYYANLIEEKLKTQDTISILDIGGDKGVIFDILTKNYPQLNYYNLTDVDYNTENERINKIILSRIEQNTLDTFLEANNEQYDVVIADFIHRCIFRDLLFANFFSKVKAGGLFVIEDLQTDKEITNPEKNHQYGWGDPNKKSMTQLIEQFKEDQTFQSDYYDFGNLNEDILSTEIFKTEAGSELGLIFKK